MNKTGTLLSRDYITCAIVGRTGNIMFEIAHAYAKALKYNRQFVAPYIGEVLYFKDSLFRKIDFFSFSQMDNLAIKEKQGPFEYAELEPYKNEPTKYVGYYQSEKYFEGYTEAIRSLYSPPLDFIKKAIAEHPFLFDSTVAALNVRRGDYLTQSHRHPVVSLEYIEEAYKRLPDHDFLLVLSDDMEWCKEKIKFKNTVFVDINKFWNQEGIWLMSLCDYFIISNSSYSWWGAWLSSSANKKVITPSTWVGPGVVDDVRDIWCDGWTKIPTKYSDGSIILNV